MFVALRDLRFAKGRFALMGSVVLLITVLVTMLSGLTAGLARDNISAIGDLRADHLVFSGGEGDGKISFSDSRITERAWQGWQDVPGVRAEPLGISMNRLTFGASGESGASAALFGVRPGTAAAPAGTAPSAGTVVLSAGLAEESGLKPGTKVQVAGHPLTVAGTGAASSYSHAPVAWLNLSDWRTISSQGPGQVGTVLALSTSGGADLAAADRKLGTTTVARADAPAAISSYSAENGSLQLMRGFLFVISALVIGAFFTVWTIQRRGDVAVLKALGASTGYLLRDALAQAVIVLLLGAGAGGAIAAVGGLLAQGGVPFVLSAATTVVPVAIMILLGAAGAALAIRKITSVDPLTALGASR
ncbi:ABC transporter permease [Spirillospora sp. NBC_01491]|uniref:ABC transporter permease n=1 Tax=Spirillospora sp. NBC_01491 TaxID=2976007 RepID=UPI002E3108E9|nr:ABC transporter permease [Spirillospora sp. NBC_01491]